MNEMLTLQSIHRPLQVPIQKNYAAAETSFARRLQRTFLEHAYRGLLNPKTDPSVNDQRFKFSFTYSSRDRIMGRLRVVLGKGYDEHLDNTYIPFKRLGGAGTHFRTNSETGGALSPAKEPLFVRSFGPDPNLMVETPRNERDFMQLVDAIGYGGEWFDSDDIERYLKSKGIFLNGYTTFVDIELISNQYSSPPAQRSNSGGTVNMAGMSREAGYIPEMQAPMYGGIQAQQQEVQQRMAESARRHNSLNGAQMAFAVNGQQFTHNPDMAGTAGYHMNQQQQQHNQQDQYQQPRNLDAEATFPRYFPNTSAPYHGHQPPSQQPQRPQQPQQTQQQQHHHLHQQSQQQDRDQNLPHSQQSQQPQYHQQSPPHHQSDQSQQIPQRRTITLDVATLIDYLAPRSVCLGRSPGMRKEDVDIALSMALQQAL